MTSEPVSTIAGVSPDPSNRPSRLVKILVVAAWIAVAVIANVVLALIPAKARDAGSALLPQDAATVAATNRISQAFPGTGTNAIAYLVLQGSDTLKPADQNYYDAAVSALRADSAHVGAVLDWWSDPLTAELGTSPDGRSSIALVWLKGEAGTTQARESLNAARSTVRKLAPSAGLRARIAAPATTTRVPLNMTAWQSAAIVITAAIITVLLLWRAQLSKITAGIALVTAGLSLAVAWPLAAVSPGHGGENVSVFTVFSGTLATLLTLGTIAASTMLLVRRSPQARGPAWDWRAYRDVTPALTLPGLCIATLTGPLLFARTPALHTIGTATLGVVVALAASLTLLPALIGLADSSGRAWLRTEDDASTPLPSLPRFSVPIVIIAVVLSICALPVIGMRWGLAAKPADASSDKLFPGNPLPAVMVVKSDQNLRNPAGLIAIDRLSRRLMEIPGVRKVQSAAWPAGVPWNEASLTTHAGTLSQQLNRQAATFVPQVKAIKTLASVLDQVSGAVDELQASVNVGMSGLTEMQHDVDRLISGTQNIKDTTVEVAGYLDPVRGWMNGVANCPADVLCATARKVVDPLDAVIADVEVLSDGADHIAAVANTTVGAFASTPRVMAQMQSALSQLRSFVPKLETTIEDTIPQAVQLSAFLRNLSNDFADTGEGGFYLSKKELADPSYQHVRQTMFSPDGTATRLFVYSDSKSMALDAAARAQQLDIAAGSVMKYGSLVDSKITVSGGPRVAADVRSALTHDAVLLAVAMLVVVVVVSMWRGSQYGFAVGLGVLASFFAALGIAIGLWQYLLSRQLYAPVAPASFAILAACGVPYLIAALVDIRAPLADGVSARGSVAPLTALGGVFGGGLVLVSGGSLSALSQLGTVLIIGLGVLMVVAKVCIPTALRADRDQRAATGSSPATNN